MSKLHQPDDGTLILTPYDLRVMTTALDRIDMTGRKEYAVEERELVGKAVIHLYSAGMTDLDLLTDAARIMAATQRIGREPRYNAA